MYGSALLVIFLVYTQPVQSALKKCQDDDGKLHYYTHAMPVECQDKTTVEMTKHGVIIRMHSTEEAKHETEEELEQRAAQEKQLIEEKRHDTVLLSTYTSEEEITRTLERNIQPVKSTIAGIKKRLEIAIKQFKNLQHQAHEAKKTENTALSQIQQNMIPIKRDIEQLQNELKQNHRRINDLKEKSAADKKRFRTLKQQEL